MLDLEKTHDALIAALKGVADGKALADFVVTPDYGRAVKIETALRQSLHLDEAFHVEDLFLADRAFAAIGLARVGNHKAEIADTLLLYLH